MKLQPIYNVLSHNSVLLQISIFKMYPVSECGNGSLVLLDFCFMKFQVCELGLSLPLTKYELYLDLCMG